MNDEESAEYQPGSHGCHEAYHMAGVLMTQVQDQLCAHPAIRQRDDWLALAEAARVSLRDLFEGIAYQHLPLSYRARAVNYYENDTFDERACDKCGKLYRGPAVYCSLTCAKADAR